eukprot:1048971-Prorocentrum_minimum.AAC.2
MAAHHRYTQRQLGTQNNKVLTLFKRNQRSVPSRRRAPDRFSGWVGTLLLPHTFLPVGARARRHHRSPSIGIYLAERPITVP